MSDSKATTPAAPEGLERLSRQLKANARADIDGESLYLKAAVALDQAAALLQSRDSAIAERDARIAALEKENADLVKQVNGLIERVDELKRALRITEPAIRHVRA